MYKVEIAFVIDRKGHWGDYRKKIHMPIVPIIGMQLFIDTFKGKGDFLHAIVDGVLWAEGDDYIEVVVSPAIDNDAPEDAIIEDPDWKDA